MKIETKFSLDEIVYFMYKNKVNKASIKAIRVSLYSDYGPKQFTEYICEYKKQKFEFEEHEIFKSKEELLKSL